MTWNLRLVNTGDEQQLFVEICEVYYNEIGKPIGYSHATMGGETVDEVRQYLTWSIEALDKPTLSFKDKKHG